jgi:hypothetical protein
MKTVITALLPVERHPGEVKGLFSNISNYAPAFRTAAEMLTSQPDQTAGEKK